MKRDKTVEESPDSVKIYSQKDVDKMVEDERNFIVVIFIIFFTISLTIILFTN